MRVKWGIRLGVLALAPLGLLVQPLSAQAPTLRPTTTTTSTWTSTSTTTTTTLAPEPTMTTATPSTTVVPRRLPRTGGSVALTFDDGPSETFTPQVLDILARYNVKATFFLVGREAEASPALVQRMVAEGHVVGNHTWDHVDLTSLDEEGFRQQIDRTEDLLRAQTGQAVPCVRPPEGRVNSSVIAALNARGLRMMKWNRDTEDWKTPGVDAIVRRATTALTDGRVILLHDGGPDMSQTVAALPSIIEGIQAQGLQISPVCSA